MNPRSCVDQLKEILAKPAEEAKPLLAEFFPNLTYAPFSCYVPSLIQKALGSDMLERTKVSVALFSLCASKDEVNRSLDTLSQVREYERDNIKPKDPDQIPSFSEAFQSHKEASATFLSRLQTFCSDLTKTVPDFSSSLASDSCKG